MRTNARTSSGPGILPLTKGEIDRRIDTLAQDLASAARGPKASLSGEWAPRWISAAELVRRMHPFIASN